jgi:hypothetical protein
MLELTAALGLCEATARISPRHARYSSHGAGASFLNW